MAHTALGTNGAAAATVCLVILTVATLVSQLSRAASLFVDTTSTATATWATVLVPFASSLSAMTRYRLGCMVAAVLGAVVSFGGGGRSDTKRNGIKKQQSTDKTSTALATTAHAVLTAVFLLFVVLLFQAGQAESRNKRWRGKLTQVVLFVLRLHITRHSIDERSS